jgi:Na+/melibiose symporter-like transporter
MESWFLGVYFVAAALALPVWTRCIARLGLERSWFAGMVLAVGVFVFAALLDAGDTTAFLIVCTLSGVAMAVDLIAPAALLAGLLQTGEKEIPDAEKMPEAGTYFGWWNLATKFNLALAAGISLPLLNLLGYAPGMRTPEALQSLTWTYCLLPCGLKVIAALLLLFHTLRKPL